MTAIHSDFLGGLAPGTRGMGDRPPRAAAVLGGAALSLLLLAAGCSDDDGPDLDAAVDASPPPDASTADAQAPEFPFPARVLRVIDGDTIEVSFKGVDVTIRFLGINCPELNPTPEPYAQEAKQFTAQHAIPAFTVGLEFDDDRCGIVPSPAGCLDYYDRLLAYIRTPERQDLSALLLAGGLARVYTAEACGRQEDYLQLQAQAQVDGVGIWAQ